MKSIWKEKMKLVFSTLVIIFFGFLLAHVITSGFFKNSLYADISRGEQNTATASEPYNQNLSANSRSYFIRNSDNLDKKYKVSAAAYLVGDLDTGEIIIEKNKDAVYPLASVSKLMTALVTENLTNGKDVASVSKKALSTYGKNGNFKLKEKIKVSDLLFPLLLESSNDAAEIIAEYFGRNSFLKNMNSVAENIGMTKTFFEDPSGLSPDNKSSVSDMFRLAQYIKEKNPDIFNITTKRSYSTGKHNWFSNNQFLREDGYAGGKSGYTDLALQTVISTFSIPTSNSQKRNLGITLLRSKDRFKDVENIVKYLEKDVFYGNQSDISAEWVKENGNIADTYEQNFVDLYFAGDIMLDRGVKNSVNKNLKGDYSALFEKLGTLKKSDIAFANLEGPASDTGKDMHNLYSFRMDPSVLPALKGAGFSVLSVANNHEGDWGRIAFEDTMSNMKENEIAYTGGGQDKNEAETPTIVEKYGMKIGFLGFSDVGPNWLNASEKESGILLASDPYFDEIIQRAGKQVDFLIVSFHFGDEYKKKHNLRQEYLAHKAIDDGAKIIIGSHPHVIEDTEIYKGGFIAYSLGNLIFDQGFSEGTMEGMLLKVRLERNGNMSVKKDILKLGKSFLPDKLIEGKEEKIKF